MLVKKALIRKPGYPIGQPGPMFIRCCEVEIDLTEPFNPDAPPVTCPVCKVAYLQTGWIKDDV